MFNFYVSTGRRLHLSNRFYTADDAVYVQPGIYFENKFTCEAEALITREVPDTLVDWTQRGPWRKID